MRAVFAEHSFPLYQLMEYQLGWRDEHGALLERPVDHVRLYGALCCAAGKALGGDLLEALPAATSVELVQNFFQVHLDVQGGSQDRYGRPTVWWVSGPGQAINVGDAFHAIARLTLMRQKHKGDKAERVLQAVQMLDAACLRMCEGHYMDLVNQERVDITVDAHLRMIREKVGALVGCTFELGSLTTSAPAEASQRLRDFGEELGIAFQVQEEILELWGEPDSGNARSTALLNKRKSLPIVYALEEGPIRQKRALGNLYFKRVLEAADLDQLVSILDDVGSRAFAQQTVERFFEQAMHHLDDLPLSPAGRESLERVAHFLAFREA